MRKHNRRGSLEVVELLFVVLILGFIFAIVFAGVSENKRNSHRTVQLLSGGQVVRQWDDVRVTWRTGNQLTFRDEKGEEFTISGEFLVTPTAEKVENLKNSVN